MTNVANNFLVFHTLLLLHSPEGSSTSRQNIRDSENLPIYCTKNRTITNAYHVDIYSYSAYLFFYSFVYLSNFSLILSYYLYSEIISHTTLIACFRILQSFYSKNVKCIKWPEAYSELRRKSKWSILQNSLRILAMNNFRKTFNLKWFT